jgi:phenylcoumaran benzylic ether reductase
MPKTLIVGATGHLGQQMLDACKKQGHEVHALVRPATRDDATKMKSLQAIGATIHEGDLKDYGSLVKACKAADNVISVIGSFQIGEEGPLVKAVKEAGIKRFIPSDYGLDPAAAGPGSLACCSTSSRPFTSRSRSRQSRTPSCTPMAFSATECSPWVI